MSDLKHTMLNDAKQYSRIYLAYSYTDLCFGIDGLARVVQDNFSLDPFRKGILFCGRRSDRIKGLLWEGDGSCSFIKGWNRSKHRKRVPFSVNFPVRTYRNKWKPKHKQSGLNTNQNTNHF